GSPAGRFSSQLGPKHAPGKGRPDGRVIDNRGNVVQLERSVKAVRIGKYATEHEQPHRHGFLTPPRAVDCGQLPHLLPLAAPGTGGATSDNVPANIEPHDRGHEVS